MPEKKEKKGSIWNKLFVLTTIIVAGLIALLFYVNYRQESVLDTSFPFNTHQIKVDNYTHAATFASDLARTDASIVLEGVELDASVEKAILVNTDSNTAVFAQGIYDKAYPASITKLMTAILALEYNNMDEVVVMTEDDFNLEEGSQVSGLVPGDTLTMRELFNILVVYSANDASMAIARTIDGSVPAFVDHMNRKARELGMIQTHFSNPSGLHDAENYTSAYDVYLMMNEVLKYDLFREVCGRNMYILNYMHADGTEGSLRLDSTDKYLTGEKTPPAGVSLWGGKTGTTDEAGACLTIAFQNSRGVPYIAVILNAFNRSILYDDMNKLLEHAY